MSRRMLIDASHPEETRVVVVQDGRVEEFDYENPNKVQLKGNIYLAKVSRVEPSLQAAFVDYGGNRHGFLPFTEIHPDYYRIPIADRQALLAEEAALSGDIDEDEEASSRAKTRGRTRRGRGRGARAAKPSADVEGTGEASEDLSAEADAGVEPETATDDTAEAAVTPEAPDAQAGEEDAIQESHGAPEPDDRATDTADDEDAIQEGHGAPEPDDRATEAADDEDTIRNTDDETPEEPDGSDGGGGRAVPAIIDDEDFKVSAEPEDLTAPAGGDEAPVEAAGEPAAADERDSAEPRRPGRSPGTRRSTRRRSPRTKREGSGRDGGARRRSPAREPASDEADVEEVDSEDSVDTLTGDETEEFRRRRANLLRRYKIQEVIKRRQVLLVQITKEERGNKGAAQTSYLSLAGRYCVLMPNSGKGGGISRKITNPKDRRRLKEILSELEIPEVMSVIVRTAGAQRTKAEIRRDYEYLMRLWDEIRTKTFESTAPALIHEEGNLIKRSIRDLYARDMEEVLIEGEAGYKLAKDFMKTLMPSHARKVKLYSDEKVPLFHKFGVEEQLDAMHEAQVELKSGGYIVIHPTEALVSIDVNSGRATKERHIEETALRTNLEAADEVARQLRLRDLAGLIVVDFIDMEDPRHNREVERRLKDAMKGDRARIQLGRISPFGLLEMSRQRMRPSIYETASSTCPTCHGTGFVRSPESSSLQVLRALTDDAIKGGAGHAEVKVPSPVALFLLNEKRRHLLAVEDRFGLGVTIRADDSLPPSDYSLMRVVEDGEAPPAIESREQRQEDGDQDDARGRRRGRRGGQGSRSAPAEERDDRGERSEREATGGRSDEGDEQKSSRRRRGKRGGRRRNRRDNDASVEATDATNVVPESTDEQPALESEDSATAPEAFDVQAEDQSEADRTEPQQDAPKPRRRRPRKTAASHENDEEAATMPVAEALPDAPAETALTESGSGEAEPAETPVATGPSNGGGRRDEDVDTPPSPVENTPVVATAQADVEDDDPDKPRRRGWWNRVLGS